MNHPTTLIEVFVVYMKAMSQLFTERRASSMLQENDCFIKAASAFIVSDICLILSDKIDVISDRSIES